MYTSHREKVTTVHANVVSDGPNGNADASGPNLRTVRIFTLDADTTLFVASSVTSSPFGVDLNFMQSG